MLSADIDRHTDIDDLRQWKTENYSKYSFSGSLNPYLDTNITIVRQSTTPPNLFSKLNISLQHTMCASRLLMMKICAKLRAYRWYPFGNDSTGKGQRNELHYCIKDRSQRPHEYLSTFQLDHFFWEIKITGEPHTYGYPKSAPSTYQLILGSVVGQQKIWKLGKSIHKHHRQLNDKVTITDGMYEAMMWETFNEPKNDLQRPVRDSINGKSKRKKEMNRIASKDLIFDSPSRLFLTFQWKA